MFVNKEKKEKIVLKDSNNIRYKYLTVFRLHRGNLFLRNDKKNFMLMSLIIRTYLGVN